MATYEEDFFQTIVNVQWANRLGLLLSCGTVSPTTLAATVSFVRLGQGITPDVGFPSIPMAGPQKIAGPSNQGNVDATQPMLATYYAWTTRFDHTQEKNQSPPPEFVFDDHGNPMFDNSINLIANISKLTAGANASKRVDISFSITSGSFSSGAPVPTGMSAILAKFKPTADKKIFTLDIDKAFATKFKSGNSGSFTVDASAKTIF